MLQSIQWSLHALNFCDIIFMICFHEVKNDIAEYKKTMKIGNFFYYHVKKQYLFGFLLYKCLFWYALHVNRLKRWSYRKLFILNVPIVNIFCSGLISINCALFKMLVDFFRFMISKRCCLTIILFGFFVESCNINLDEIIIFYCINCISECINGFNILKNP